MPATKEHGMAPQKRTINFSADAELVAMIDKAASIMRANDHPATLGGRPWNRSSLIRHAVIKFITSEELTATDASAFSVGELPAPRPVPWADAVRDWLSSDQARDGVTADELIAEAIKLPRAAINRRHQMRIGKAARENGMVKRRASMEGRAWRWYRSQS